MGYNALQLQDILRQAGWPESAPLPVMAAIALAESSGVATRHNPIPPDDSYGLWQINMLGAMGPQRRAQFGIQSNAELYDPVTNARAAWKIYNQQGLRAWSTYSNGAYKKYLAASQAAYSPPSNDPTDTPATTTPVDSPVPVVAFDPTTVTYDDSGAPVAADPNATFTGLSPELQTTMLLAAAAVVAYLIIK